MTDRWGIARRDDGRWVAYAGDRELGSGQDRDGAMSVLIGEYAAAPATPALQTGQRAFRIPLLIAEGIETGDGRFIEKGATTWRDLPLPLMLLTETSWGHDGAVIAGRIDQVSRVAGGVGDASGVYLDTDDGQMAAHLAEQQAVRGISADLDMLEVEFEETGEVDDDGWVDVLMRVTAGRVIGATQCPMPAFQECTIECDPLPVDDAAAASVSSEELATATHAAQEGARPLRWSLTLGERQRTRRPVMAAAIDEVPVAPAAWFADPQLPGPTPLTVTPEGRVYGHLCEWGTQHIGVDGPLVPPREATPDYPHFRLGSVELDDGSTVAVGALTVGTGHASIRASATEAAAHYDNTGAAAAHVAAGNDEHGVWVAGWVNPAATPEQIYALRASALSGDWRPKGTKRELVAALAVNVAGFPIPRAQSFTRNGRQLALVAAGARELFVAKQPVERHEHDLVLARLRRVEAVAEALAPVAASGMLEQYDRRGRTR